MPVWADLIIISISTEILPGYYHYWNHSEREEYSGTALQCHKKPLSKFKVPKVLTQGKIPDNTKYELETHMLSFPSMAS